MIGRRVEWTRAFAFAFAGLAALFFAAMLVAFAFESAAVWRALGLAYPLGPRWFFRAQEFGAAAMIYGTTAVAAVALLVAAPLGIGAALWIAEYLPGRARWVAKGTVELLAGVPSVVYGLLGVVYLRTWVYEGATWAGADLLSGDTLLTAGLLLGVMVLPTVTTLADDALRGVPAAQRHAARGLGLSRAEAIGRITLPQALPGLAAAVLLGLGRALGETIAVFLVVGRQDNRWPANLLSLDPLLEAGQTLTSKLGGSETHIAYGEPLHWAAIVGLGLLLLLIVVTVTLAGAALFEKGGRRARHA